MKKKTVKAKSGLWKYLFVFPLFLLSFCQSEFEEPNGVSENKLTIDANVLFLMKSAIQSNSDQILTQNKDALSKSTATEDDGQCTNFLYPMTFQVYSRDDPIPETKEINSDEELIAFIDVFTSENSAGAYSPNYEMFIYFPIILLDTDGYETELNNLTELEGTLEMAVKACESFNADSDGSSGAESDSGSDSGSDGSSGDDGSSDGSDGDSGAGSSDGSDGSSGAESDSGSDGGSDGSSGDDSDNGSDDSSADDGSSDGSDGSSGAESDSGSDGGSDGSSGDDSDNGSDDSSADDGSSDGSDGSSGAESDSGSDSGSVNVAETEQSDDDNGFKFCDKNSKKVYICHKGKTICVSVNAIWGHMNHHEEDYLGTCED